VLLVIYNCIFVILNVIIGHLIFQNTYFFKVEGEEWRVDFNSIRNKGKL